MPCGVCGNKEFKLAWKKTFLCPQCYATVPNYDGKDFTWHPAAESLPVLQQILEEWQAESDATIAPLRAMIYQLRK